MAEIEVQPDQTGNVIRVVATLENRQARRFDIRRLMIQRYPQLVTALRHGHRVLVFAENRLVTTVRVEIEVVDGVFLAFGPQAFTGDIAANRRQHI